jgi:hypothetical protein
MTTHDQRNEITPPPGLSNAPTEHVQTDDHTNQTGYEAFSSPANSDPVITRTEPAGETADPIRSGTQASTDRPLFAESELAELRARWDNVQTGFVDDPKDCVQKADGLVSDVVEHLTRGFTEARSRLEQHWGRGEEASTEDLRVALKRYREFFDRLLAV